MLEHLLKIVAALFVGVWVARYLGPQEYGLLSYAQSFVGLFAVISSLGLDSILFRELIKDSNNEKILLATAFGLKLIGAIALLIVLFITVQFVSNTHETNALIFIIGSASLFNAFNVFEMYFRAKVLGRYVALVQITTLIVSSILKIVLIVKQFSVIAFALMIVFDAIFLATGLVYYFKTYSRNNCNSFSFNKKIAVSLLNDSWPLIISGSMLMVQAYIDQVMLKEYLGSTQVGYYSIAIKIIAIFGFVPTVLKNSLFPAIQSAKNISDTLYKERLLNYYRLNFVLFLLIATPVFIFSETIIILLFGQVYQPAGILLAILSLRLFFANMGVARGAFILCENLMKFSTITMALGTITNVLFNYTWIPNYGAKV